MEAMDSDQRRLNRQDQQVQWQISALVLTGLTYELADPNAADLRASILGVASRNYLIRLLNCRDKDLVFVACAIAVVE